MSEIIQKKNYIFSISPPLETKRKRKEIDQKI